MSLTAEVIACRRCPRLVAWREEVAREKRAAYQDWDYWGRPVPGFGDPGARLLILGLAPAAHGGNRTGRVFTGDRSGDWLFRALHRAGFANQPTSAGRDDGLRLSDAYIAAAVRCAPPANRPSPEERDNCLPYLERELQLLTDLRAFVCLGSFAYDALSRVLGLRSRPRFGHGVEARLADDEPSSVPSTPASRTPSRASSPSPCLTRSSSARVKSWMQTQGARAAKIDLPMEEPAKSKEPLILWWMPVVALLAPMVWAAWRAFGADDGSLEDGLKALAWPGIALYLGSIAVLWAGWKIELE